MSEIKFKRLSEDATLPTRATPGDAGLDLYASEWVAIAGGGNRNWVGTGIAVEIPEGYVGLVYIRSGLSTKNGIMLSNSVGVIDSGYRGEIKANILNTGEEMYCVEPGDRIAQLVITPFLELTPVEVDELKSSERGDKGFGSSGR